MNYLIDIERYVYHTEKRICRYAWCTSQAGSTIYSMRDSPLPQTEEQRIEQDNREGKPDIDIYLNKGT